jgi:MarR family transcriptional regulator, organic hydroperoxide resistance regulator
MRPLDEMVCFSLYTASRATTQAYRRVLAPWKLTYPQYLVLVALWTGGSRTVGELGDDLLLDSGTLSPLLRRLEDAGIVRRQRRADDERVVDVHLTSRGRELRDEMRDVPVEIHRCLGIGMDAARHLLDSLHELARSARENTEAHAS